MPNRRSVSYSGERIGAMEVIKGTEYTFPVLTDGNAIRVQDRTRVSINRTPLDATDPTEIFKLADGKTISFEKDTVIAVYKIP